MPRRPEPSPAVFARIVRGGLLTAGLLATALAAPARAGATLPQPQGRVMLAISGAIETTNGGGARFDRATLERLGVAEVNTSTPRTDGVERTPRVKSPR